MATTHGVCGLFAPEPGEVVTATQVPVVTGPWQGVFTRIVFPAPDVAFAAYNWATGGIVLGFDGQGWQPTPGQPPVGQYFNDGIYGLAVSKSFLPAGIGMLFASTNDGVYVSRDRASTWLDCSSGLPACPQCADIQCADGPAPTVPGAPQGSVLYVGTWGRSVWMASLREAESRPRPVPLGGR